MTDTLTTQPGAAQPHPAQPDAAQPGAQAPDPAVGTRPRTHTEWLALAGDVAGTLAEDALARDRANLTPTAEVQLLKRSGLTELLVPAGLGGGGGRWSTALQVVRRLATTDASIAQLLGYHYVNQANLWFLAGAEGRERWARESLAGRWVWGDAVNPVDPDLVLRRDGDGFRLAGTKRFATGSGVGDVVVAGGRVDDEDDQLLVLVPRDRAGVSPAADWDNLGQRLSDSGSVTFADVRVEGAEVLGSLHPERATPRSSLVTPAIQAVFGHLYLGVAEGALAVAARYTRAESRPWLLSGLDRAADDPYVLATYGDLVARTRAVGALADQVGDHLDRADTQGAALTWPERGELAVHVAALKVVSTDLSLDATNRIFEVTGARASANRHGFDRFWRNVRTHTLHDPVAWKRREVGRHFLDGTHPAFTLYT